MVKILFPVSENYKKYKYQSWIWKSLFWNILDEVQLKKGLDLVLEVWLEICFAAIDGLLSADVHADGGEKRRQILQTLDRLHSKLKLALAKVKRLDVAELKSKTSEFNGYDSSSHSNPKQLAQVPIVQQGLQVSQSPRF